MAKKEKLTFTRLLKLTKDLEAKKNEFEAKKEELEEYKIKMLQTYGTGMHMDSEGNMIEIKHLIGERQNKSWKGIAEGSLLDLKKFIAGRIKKYVPRKSETLKVSTVIKVLEKIMTQADRIHNYQIEDNTSISTTEKLTIELYTDEEEE